MILLCRKCGSLDVSQPYGFSRPVTGIALPFHLANAAPEWGYAAKTHINKLQIFQNKVLRIITKLPRVTPIETLHEQTGMETIQTHVSILNKKFWEELIA
jgi:hypothetical protein